MLQKNNVKAGIELAREALVQAEYARPKNTLRKYECKPTHGNCCTCQDCWWDHDSCICEDLRFHEVLDKLITKLNGDYHEKI